MSPAVLEGTDTIDRLDFEPVVPCEYESEVCTLTAKILIVCRVCGFSTTSCFPCHAYVLGQIDALHARHGLGRFLLGCTECNAKRWTYYELWAVLPLKVGDS